MTVATRNSLMGIARLCYAFFGLIFLAVPGNAWQHGFDELLDIGTRARAPRHRLGQFTADMKRGFAEQRLGFVVIQVLIRPVVQSLVSKRG